ncbi:hypothetical protein ABPG72_011665 [Tetrahymena utriculariae]
MERLKNFYKPFYSTIMESMITSNINLQKLSSILIWFNFLQVVSFSFLPFSTTNLLNASLKWYEGYRIILFIVRPCLLFIFSRQASAELPFFIVSSIVILAFFLGFLSLIIFTYSTKKKQIASQKQNDNQKVLLYLKKIATFISIFGGLFNYWMFLAVTESVLVLGVVGTYDIELLQSNSYKIYGITFRILSIIFSLISLGLSLLSSYLFEQSFSILEKNLNRSQITSISSFQNVLKYVLVLINAFRFKLLEPNAYEEKASSQALTLDIAINFIVILYFIIMSIDFWKELPFSNIPKCNQYVSSLVICGFSSIFASISFTFNLVSSISLTTLCLVILPIISQSLQVFWERLLKFILFDVFCNEEVCAQEEMKFLQKKISLMYNNKQYLMQKCVVEITGLIQQHQKVCSDLYCFCKSGKGLYKGQDETKFLIDEIQIERYLRHLCRIDLDRKKSDQENFHFQFLRYMDFFCQSNKETYSIQKIIDFLNEQNKMRREINVLQEASLLTMLDVIKNQMQYQLHLHLNDNDIQKAILQINNYVVYEQEKDVVNQLLLKAIELKIQTYEKMRKQFQNITELEKVNFNTNENLRSLEKKIVHFFNRFPNKKNQNYLCFYLTEIQNNFKKAIDVSRQVSLNGYQGDFTIQHKNNIMNIFGSDVVSATITMGKVWGRIQRVSDQLPTVLGYKKQEFQYINHIKEIMPVTIAKIHDDLIKYLMTTGQDNIIHSRRDLFLRNKNNFLVRAQIFISLNLHYKEELPYVAFAKIIPTYSGFFVVNSNGIIEGIDQNILEKFGYIGKYKINCLPAYISFDIRQFFANYDNLINSIDSQLNYLQKEKVPFIFPNKNHPIMMSLIQNSMQQSEINPNKNENMQVSQIEMNAEDEFMKLSKQSDTKLKKNQQLFGSNISPTKQSNLKEQSFTKYLIDINIEKRDLHVLTGKYSYFVIEVKNSTLAQDDNSSKYESQFSKKQVQFSEKQNSSHVKFNQNLKSQNTKEQYLASLSNQLKNFKNIENNIDTFRDNESQIQEDIGLSKVNTTRQFKNGQFQQVNEDLPKDLFAINDSFNNNNFKPIQNISKDFLQNSGLKHKELSFNQDQSFLVQNSSFQNDQLLSIPSNLQKNDYQSSVSTNSKQQNSNIYQHFNQQDQHIQDDIEALQDNLQKEEKIILTKSSSTFSDTQEEKKIQFRHKDNVQGENASVASTNSNISKFIDKYVYYEHFLRDQNSSISIKLVGLVKIIEYLLLVATVIVLLSLIFDLFNFLSSLLNSLNLNSNSSFHYYNFLALSNNFIINIQSNFYSTQQEIKEEFTLLTNRLETQFSNFSESFRKEYQESYGQTQFTENYILTFQSFSSNSNNEQSLINLSTLAQIVYHMQIIQRRTAPQDWVQNLNDDSYKFLSENFVQFFKSLDQIQKNQFNDDQKYLEDKQKSLLLATILLNLALLFIQLINLVTFLKFEKCVTIILKLIQNVSLIQVETELERMQNIYETVKYTEQPMLLYQFSIKQKEYRIIAEDQKKRRLLQKENKEKQISSHRVKQNVQLLNERMKLSKFFVTSILVYLFFLTYTISIYTLTNQFIENSNQSLNFYRDFSDMNLQLPLLTNMQYYLHQQKLSQNQNLVYINSEDLNFLSNTLYNQTTQRIVSFQNVVQSVYSLSLFNQNFQTQLYNFVNQDICQPGNLDLDPQFLQNCQLMYNGQLTKGLQSFMNYLYSKFDSNQNSNFKNQMDVDIYDNIALSSLACSMQILKSRDFFEVSFYNQANNYRIYFIILSVIFLVITSIQLINLMFHDLPIVKRRLQYSKYILHIIPSHTLIIDDTFFKILKAISNKLNISK